MNGAGKDNLDAHGALYDDRQGAFDFVQCKAISIACDPGNRLCGNVLKNCVGFLQMELYKCWCFHHKETFVRPKQVDFPENRKINITLL